MQLCLWLLVIRELQNGWDWKWPLEVICLSSGSNRATYIKFFRIISRWVSNISNGGDSTVSLDNLCQCLATLIAKKYFLMLTENLLCFSLCPLSLVLSLKTPEGRLGLSSLHPPYRNLYKIVRSPSNPSLSCAEQCQLSQPFLICVAL